MPSSYAVMEEDEMCYVEGGGWQDLALDLPWSRIAAISILTGVVGITVAICRSK